jgi:hypothetical protein
MRKLLVYIIIAIALIAGSYLIYNKYVKQKKVLVSESLKAIPVDASLILEIRDIAELNAKINSDGPLFSKLNEISDISKTRDFIGYLDTLAQTNNVASNLIANKSIFVSFHKIGKSKLQSLWVIKVPEGIKEEDIIKLFKKELETKATIMERSYDDVDMYDARYNLGKQNLCFTVYQQNIIFSFSSMLVEDAVRQLKYSEQSILDNSAFMQVYNTAGQKEMLNMFVQYDKLPSLFSSLLDQRYLKYSDFLANWSTWTELDINADELSIKLNGFSEISDTVHSFVRVLASQEAVEFEIESVLPAQTSLYLGISFLNHKEFSNKLDEWMKVSGCLGSVEEIISRYENQTSTNIRELFYPLIDAEVAFAITEVNALDIFQNGVIIIKTQSQSVAKEAVAGALQKYADNTNKTLGQYISKAQIDAGAQYDVYQLPWNELGYGLFGPWFSGVQCNYLVFYGNYMIIGSSAETLSRFVHTLLLNKTLATDLTHNKFMSYFSEKSNLFCYVNTVRSKALLLEWLTSNVSDQFNTDFKAWSAMSEIGIQMASGNEMIYNYCVIKYTENYKDEPKTVWASQLDTLVINKPALVANHITGGKEIVMQDANNTLYLVSNSGREIWKIPVDEPIIGDIYQVDAFKNGKLQYFFITKSQMHLVDRLGNYVGNFPVPLRSTATAGPGVFDYDNSRDYRILVACDDKNAYLYDIEGKIVNGWEFKGSEHIVYSAPQHFRNGTKDYIVMHDEHKLYILDRTGQTRVETKATFNFSNNQVFFESSNGTISDRFICSEVRFKLIYQYLDGKVDSLNLAKLKDNHHFSAYDIDFDGSLEYFTINGKLLLAYNSNGTELFSKEFPSEIDAPVYFYRFPRNQIKIGIVCSNANLIYLLNDDGTIYKGFPLHGVTAFSIGYLYNNSESFNLVVGGKENVLYNYEVKE